MKNLYLIVLFLFTYSAVAQCSFGEVEYNITINSSESQYPDENSWTVAYLDGGEVIASVECGYYTGQDESVQICVDLNQQFTFIVYDDWGDGWNGGWFEITDSEGCAVIPQTYPNDGLAGDDALGCTNLDTEYEVVLTAGAPIEGCTDPNADNYNPCAVVDDGNCQTCGNMLCEGTESYQNCPTDCACTFAVEWADFYSLNTSSTPVPICGYDPAFPISVPNNVILLPFATFSDLDESYTVTSSVGTVFLDEVDAGFVNYVQLDDDDIAASGGQITITMTSPADPNCTGTLTTQLSDIEIENSYADYCSCGQVVWLDELNVEVTGSPIVDCEPELGAITVAIGVFSVSEPTFNISVDVGYFESTGNSNTTINNIDDGDYLDAVVINQADFNASSGVVNFTVTSTNDPNCNGTRQLNLSWIGSVIDYCQFPINDECDNPIPLEIGSNGPFSNANGSATETDFPDNCYVDEAYESTVYFSFVGTGEYMEIITDPFCTDGVANDDTQFAVYTGCNGELVACNDDAYEIEDAPYAAIVGFLSEPGQEYILIVDGWNGTEGNFCLEVESGCFTSIQWADFGFGFEQEPDFTCNGPEEIVAPFFAFSSSQAMEIIVNAGYVTDLEGNEITEIEAQFDESELYVLHFTQADLDLDILFQLELEGTEDGECYDVFEADLSEVNVNLANLCAPPVNDECEGAIQLEYGYNDNHNNINALEGENDVFEPACFYGSDGLQSTVYYKFMGTGDNLTVTVDTTGANFDDPMEDSQIMIFEGDCEGELVACNEDMATSWNSQTSFQSIEGQVYTLMVDGYGGAQGEYFINIEETCAVSLQPEISIEDNNFGRCETMEVNIENAGDGFGIVFMVTDETSTNILIEPQGSNEIDLDPLSDGNYQLYALSFDDLENPPASGLVADLEGCFLLSEPILFSVVVCLSLTNANGSEIQIYPTITSGTVNIEMDLTDVATLNVQDLKGRVVMSKQSQSNTSFDLSDLPNATYLVNINDGKNSLTKKVIKQ